MGTSVYDRRAKISQRRRGRAWRSIAVPSGRPMQRHVLHTKRNHTARGFFWFPYGLPNKCCKPYGAKCIPLILSG